MKIPNSNAVVNCLIALSCLVCGSSANGQQQYPTTDHREFTTPGNWSVSVPDQLDTSKSPNSEMSPDHWGSSASSANPNSYQTQLTKQAWDGNLENHPWINSDETSEEAIVQLENNEWPSLGETARTPTMPIGSNDDTNFEIPLPPSAARRSDDIPGQIPPLSNPELRSLPPTSPPSIAPSGVYPLTSGDRSEYREVQTPPQSNHGISFSGAGNPAGSFRPDLGQRSDVPSYRGSPNYPDNGQQYGYEKKEYPPMREIIATGRNFGSVDVMLLRPNFQGNTALNTSDGFVVPFDYDYQFAGGLELGFESCFGPGVKIDYFQYDQNSNITSFTSDGTITGSTNVTMPGTNQWNSLTAANAGETLDVDQSLEVHLFGASFFKEMKFPISRLNANFGFKYASIAQELDSVLTNAGGAEIGRLASTTDLRAYGPNVGFEYFRPIGHTRLEIISTFGGAILMGRRDQYILDSLSGDRQRVGADEFVTLFDISSGVQSQRYFGEKRCVFWKVTYIMQTWNYGGNAADTQQSFGFRGFAFSIGFNR